MEQPKSRSFKLLRVQDREFRDVKVVWGRTYFCPNQVLVYPLNGRPFPVAIFKQKDFLPQAAEPIS